MVKDFGFEYDVPEVTEIVLQNLFVRTLSSPTVDALQTLVVGEYGHSVLLRPMFTKHKE